MNEMQNLLRRKIAGFHR